MKRIIAIILCVSMLFGTMICVSGCSTKGVHIMTRAEWIDKLANTFQLSECYDTNQKYNDVSSTNKYFGVIQACNEWEIIESSENFYPESRAETSFAITTAVKAIGLDKIEKSIDGKQLCSDDEIVNYFNDNCKVKYIKGSNLYEDTANDIIRETALLYSSLQLKQYQDVKYQENVIEVKENNINFSADGETGIINDGNYNIGDIIVIEPCETYPEGKYAKITDISSNTIKYKEPSLDEMFDHITMYGTYDPEVIGVVPLMDGVEVSSIDGVEAKPQAYYDGGLEKKIYVTSLSNLNDPTISNLAAKTFNLGDIDLKVNATAKSGNASVTVAGSVKLKNIKTTVDLDVWGPIVKKAEIKVNDTFESSISVSGQIEKTFNIAKIPCKLWGVVGVDFVLAVKIGLEGSVSFIWSVDTSQSVEYRPLRAPKFNATGSNSNVDVELKAKAYIKPEFKAEFVIGPASVANIGAYSGVEASAKTKIVGTSDDVQCVDVNAYVPLSIFVGAEKKSGDDTLLGKLGVKKSWSIWTSSTSPWKKKWHIEEGQIVPSCTKKESKNENDDVTQNDSTIETNGQIDNDLISHIYEIDDALSISCYYVVIDEGKTDVLKITHFPDGYDLASLKFSSSNSEVASVDSNGIITANGSGVCIIKVSTSDNKYEQFCSIRILASYDVSFTPLNNCFVGERQYVFSI